MVKKIVIAPIRAYQYIIRPLLPNSCVFHAHGMKSCSVYTVDSINEKGVIKGMLLGVWRIIRCNPWQKKFTDPDW